MKIKARPSFSLNLHLSTKMIECKYLLIFHSKHFFWQESKEGEVSVVHIVMKKWKLSFWWTDADSVRKMA